MDQDMRASTSPIPSTSPASPPPPLVDTQPASASLPCHSRHNHPDYPAPAPGSLRQLLLQNSTTRLYTHPLDWTAQHLGLLHCKVVQYRQNQNKKLDPKNHNPNPVPKDVLSDLFRLRIQASAGVRDAYARRIVKRLATEVLSGAATIGPGKLRLRYNQNPVCTIRLPFIATDDSGSNLLWAYVDTSWIEEQRWIAKPHRDIVADEARRARAQEQQQTPLPISPFCMAAIIAMAQQAQQAQQAPCRVILFVARHEMTPLKIPGKPSRLVSAICQYTANVSEVYLKKFDKPYECHDSDLVIQRRVILLKEETSACLYEALQASSNRPTPCRETTKRKSLAEVDHNTGAGKRMKI